MCVAYRHYLRSYPEKALFPRYRVKWLAKYFDALMEDRGWKRCARCLAIKPAAGKWNRNHCRECNNERSRQWKKVNRVPGSRLAEYKKQNDRRGSKTYGSKEAFIKAQRDRARVARAMRGRADAHVNAYVAWLGGPAPDERVALHYEAIGRPWANPRLSSAHAWRIRYREDPDFCIKERVRAHLNKAAKRNGIGDTLRYSLVAGGRSRKMERELGYTPSDLRKHLSRQFTKGMTWEEFSKGNIHIDHIVPQAAFDLSDPDQWRQCWCLSNLRPCWASENRRKSASLEFLI